MMKLVLVITGILVIVASYYQWRLRQDHRKLLDYLSDYHKTMTIQQIQAGRRFALQSDYWRQPEIVRAQRYARVGKLIAIGCAILVGLELLGLFDGTPNAQLWFSESLGGVVLGLALNTYGHWLFNQAIVQLTAIKDGVVTLASTPADLGTAAAKHHVKSRTAWVTIVCIGLFASLVNLWPVGGLRDQTVTWTVTFLVDKLKQSKPRPLTRDERTLNDAQYVRKLATSSTQSLTQKQTVGLLSLILHRGH
ncbi:hypothetical protein RA086_13190 [Lactiplantibacillus sp. WILCCON 0030]|uniref:Uncharacterized protein n=1 Tax=Lactiplantibacillus brownii TaxID=3069269 RepID=A0ABU1ACB8_9LACO|nr:hypothetical protein [Lactiplantibacillus brownii]MDQ7938563.1 hypothetical protein [Lactiplantibacillus brownii]